MKIIINILSVICFLLFLGNSKAKKDDSSYTLAFIKDVYIDEGNYTFNGSNDSVYTKGEGERTENFIGVFPKENDTVAIYKLNKDLNEKPEKFSFWSKKKNNQTITFYCSMGDDIKITFGNQNNIIINNDTYEVNKEYYTFLKQKILIEKSVLDLAFFLKDGYGDYEESLEPLNKNWRNQKEDNRFKIIKAKIKNKNYQTDDQFFSYEFTYKYTKRGIVENILGQNSFTKKKIEENNKYLVYVTDRSVNERALVQEYLYKNKKTFLDSIVGSRIRYSDATTYHYKKFQSILKTINIATKPSNLRDILKLLDLNKKNLD
ncbi:hypothetical protein N4T20_08125 [Flavobacterium sp. TR2]|uniref:hypothetical protein n=1 Tax=Flavobacterium sp. TR2 TaxID=2977321 RepID=UPI0021B09BA9|nr:hypothetical protein [Flavobacterium sp. TR2]UWY29900.1 hypothetical protein N4T20_08125 [Flavobacterium sp. TR2]